LLIYPILISSKKNKYYIVLVIYVDDHPREHSTVGRDIAYYMQGPEFEHRTPHFSIINCVSSAH